MNRADAATYIGERFGAYLLAAPRTATDSAGNLKAPIDDAFRALGYAAADIATAETDGEEADEDFRVQVSYRAMVQVVADMGATYLDVTVGDSFKLSQPEAAAERMLKRTEAAVLERFGTLGVVADDDSNSFVALDLNFLDERYEDWAVFA